MQGICIVLNSVVSCCQAYIISHTNMDLMCQYPEHIWCDFYSAQRLITASLIIFGIVRGSDVQKLHFRDNATNADKMQI